MNVNIANLAQADTLLPLPQDTEGGGDNIKPAPPDNEKRFDKKETDDAVTYEVKVVSTDSHKPDFSEYLYYAKVKRDSERNGTGGNGVRSDGTIINPPSLFSMIKGKKQAELSVGDRADMSEFHQVHAIETAGLPDAEVEKVNQRRALRIAHWSTVFFLITTDVLGPFNAPYAISNLGMVPGVLLYFFFGAIASCTGLVIAYLFIKLDSDRYPIRTFGDIGERIAGKPFRWLCIFIQSVQLIVNVGLICLSSGQSLYQISNSKLCLSVAVVIWTVIGMLAGQIRSLRNIGFVGSVSVWINLLIIFISMGVVAHTGPNYAVANAANNTLGYGPVEVVSFQSDDLPSAVVGMFNIVFAYGGAMIFPEMLAEMRRPFDFWKGMAIADTLIFTMYMMYGVFWYCFQGQYTQPNSYQGLAPYAWQTVCNVLQMITGMIAALLYGNIGIKLAYINIVEGIFKGPALASRKGRIIWTFMGPLYWALAFVVASAIPALGDMTGLIGCACIFQFSYTFPPLLWLIYKMRVDAGQIDQAYDGYGSVVKRADTWRDAARWKRAVGGKTWWIKLAAFLIFLAAVATTGLGLWGTGTAIAVTFEVGQGTSFGCGANA